MLKSVQSLSLTFGALRYFLATALLCMQLACGGGGSDQTAQEKGLDLQNQTVPGCKSVPSDPETANCPFPQTGTYTFRTETALCQSANFGKPISSDRSACVTPNLSVTMEFAQTHVIPANGLRWYKKAVVNNGVTTNEWIKVADGIRWSPVPESPSADWKKSSVPVGSEVPTGYDLNATLRINSNRRTLVLVDTGSAAVRPKNAKLQVWMDGKLQAEIPLATPENLDPTEDDGPKYAKNSYSVMLDAKYLKPGVKLKVVSDDYGVSNEVAPDLGADGEFTMWVMPFYLFGANEQNTFPLSLVGVPDAVTATDLANVWPFAKLEFKGHLIRKIEWPYLVIGASNARAAYRANSKSDTIGFDIFGSLLNTIQLMRISDGLEMLNNQYYTPFFTIDGDGKNNTQTGSGLGGGNAGVGDYDFGDTFYHEQGHAFNLGHAGDAYPNNFPYFKGSVKESAWGYDMARRKFVNRIIPLSAPEINSCKTDGKHLLTSDSSRCWKQDPMQSGQGDQAGGSRYSMMADIHLAYIQAWLEGKTTLNANGSRTYSGGKIMEDSNSPTGYSRWDTIDKKRVDFTPADTINGHSALNQGFPIKKNVPVQTIVLTHSIAGTLDISKAYPYPINPAVSQIYPLLPTRTGNLLSFIDPSDRRPEKVAEYDPTRTPNGKYKSFCNGEGCDFTLRVTFSDNTVQHILLQGLVPTRPSGQPSGAFQSFPPLGASSFGNLVVNVSAENGRTAKKAELLFTPTPWLNWSSDPLVPLVIASRVF